jgi:hypothetical protein
LTFLLFRTTIAPSNQAKIFTCGLLENKMTIQMEKNNVDLTEVALDWAVATCEGRTIQYDPMCFNDKSYWIWEEVPSGKGGVILSQSVYLKIGSGYSPSTNWLEGGPIFERLIFQGMLIEKAGTEKEQCRATLDKWESVFYGDTPLIAAMRCYVANELGEEVKIPSKLLLK